MPAELHLDRGQEFAVSPLCDGARLTHGATGSVLVVPSGMEATIPLTGLWTLAPGPPREQPHRVTVTRLPLAAVEQLAAQDDIPAHWLPHARRAHQRRT